MTSGVMVPKLSLIVKARSLVLLWKLALIEEALQNAQNMGFFSFSISTSLISSLTS